MILLITIATLLIIFMVWVLYYDVEKPYIYFLTQKDIRNFITQDYDNYIKNLTDADLHARRQQSKDNYKISIMDNVYDLSNKERKIITQYIITAYKLLLRENHYLKHENICRIPWNIAFINDDILENGLAHTQDDIIFLSTLDLNKSSFHMIETLMHEFIHIYQRKFPEVMDAYTQDNGMQYIRSKNKLDNARSNPDTDDKIYLYNGKELISRYNSQYPESITDTVNTDSEFEHPNEHMAYKISKQLMTLI